MSDIKERLKEACTGHPNAVIPWPHRLLHDAIDAIWEGEKRVEELEEIIERMCHADAVVITANENRLETENQRLREGVVNALLCDSGTQMHECLTALLGGGENG